MSGRLRERNEHRIAEEASEWLNVLERAERDDHKVFAKWVTESRRHVEEFLFASAVDRVLDRVDAKRRIDVQEVLKRASGNIVALDAPTSTRSVPSPAPRGRVRVGASLAAAASILFGCFAFWLYLNPPGSQHYRTSTGEQRMVELPDGSSVYLNTQSRARVRYTNNDRDVELISGEALFDVKRDTARPFRVRSGKTMIQALGTRFNVHRSAQATTVAIVEGAIRISTEHESSELKAQPGESIGEEARISPNGRIVQHKPVEVTRVAAWQQKRLMFRADTLEDIAAEFNRYNETPQIRIEGDEARMRRFTGVFNADDPRALVLFLGSYGDLAAEEQGNTLIIRGK